MAFLTTMMLLFFMVKVSIIGMKTQKLSVIYMKKNHIIT